jgi:LysM repeat protein
VRLELTPDELEMKEKFWNDLDAQMMLRSLVRLRKGHEQVDKNDIDDDIKDAEGIQMPRNVLDSLVQKLCDKCLISKDKDINDKMTYCIPSIDRLVPFMNAQMGELPFSEEENDDDEEDEDDNDESKEYSSGLNKSKRASYVSSDSKNERNNHLPRKIYETDRTTRNALPEPSDETSVSSISMSFSSNNGTGQPLLRRDAARSSRKVSSKKRKGEIICIENSSNQMTLSSEPLTDVDDVPWGKATSPGTLTEQPEKKRRVYYTEQGDTPNKIAKKYQVDVEQIIRDNKRRENFENISKCSTFIVNSPIVLPM